MANLIGFGAQIFAFVWFSTFFSSIRKKYSLRFVLFEWFYVPYSTINYPIFVNNVQQWTWTKFPILLTKNKSIKRTKEEEKDEKNIACFVHD